MGIETEFGISTPLQPDVSPMAASTRIVSAYALRERANASVGRAKGNLGWDYSLEAPLRDARGYDMTRAEADPTQLTDEDLGVANTVLENGARLYVDHAHPEYSSPEVTNPLDAVRWDRAGVAVMQSAMSLANRNGNGNEPVVLYKNNTDNKGASYGCHENYLMARDVAFSEVVRHLVPFLSTRQVFAGAGRLGVGQEGKVAAFQLSQRADFFEVEVGLETTLKRPIINTRDEPHADPEKYRRLHVIVGDSNMSDTATYLKMGTMAIVLTLLEAGALDGADLWPRRPVDEIHRISHDTSLRHLVTLDDGRSMTALEIQRTYLDRAVAFYGNRLGADLDEQTSHVLMEWARMLDSLEADPLSVRTEVDWLAKLGILEGFRHRDHLDWDSPRLALVDLQYSDLRPGKGLALALERRGALVRLVADADIAHAVQHPPADTRAYFRGRCMAKFPGSIAAASWDSVVFDIPGREALVRVPTLDPARGTQAMVGRILDESDSAESLLEALAAPSG